jgi:hypothetical protein
MSKRSTPTRSAEKPPGGELPAEETAGGALGLVLELLPVLWLVVVLSAYAVLALHPLEATRAEVRGIAEAERAVLPLLAALVFAAIIRYYWLRKMRLRAPEPGSGRQRARGR